VGNLVIERIASGARRWLAGNLAAAAVLAALAASPAPAQARGVLQCVTYARSLSGIEIRGNAHTWWQQAAGIYARGQRPKAGAVLAFRASGAMPLGHVAVVDRVLDDRRVLLDHANWSRPGMIERGVLAEDVSAAGDWSEVRVWYAPTASLGLRVSPAYGFIYADKGEAPQAPTEGPSRTFLAAYSEMLTPLP